MLPDKTSILAVWAFGGALAFVGALAYAELAARRPLAGGEYVYLRESFGSLAAFLTGWTSFVAGFSGGVAAGAVGLTAYIDHFAPRRWQRAATPSWHIGWVTMSLSRQSLIAIATIVALALVHARGLGPGRVVQNMLTVLKIGALGSFVVVGLIMAMRLPMPSDGPSVVTPWSSWLIALVPVMFSYSGWNAAVYVAEEIRDPVKHVPRALAFGTITVVALYLGLNALYLRVVPRAAFAGSTSVGELAAETLFGSAAASLFAAVAIVVILGSLSAMTMAGPRIYFAMARDGAFPQAGGAGPSALPHAGDRDSRADGLERGARPLGDLRPAADLHRLRGDPVFRARGVLAVLCPAHAGRRRGVPRVGVSVGAGGLLPRQPRDRHQHDRAGAGRGVSGTRRDGRRDPDLLVDAPAQWARRRPVGSLNPLQLALVGGRVILPDLHVHAQRFVSRRAHLDVVRPVPRCSR